MIDTPTSCPVKPINPDLSDLEPLLSILQQNEMPTSSQEFARGTWQLSGSLDLCKQSLGVQGCQQIAQALEAQQHIHTLLLGTNSIGDQGAVHIAELIKHGNLETIYLGCNLIGETGVQAIAKALQHDQKVKALWLKRNPLGAKGILQIAHMLETNSTLRTLDLVNTNPDHDSMLELLRVIALHPSLEYVYLSGNGLDIAEAPALATCLENPKLKGLYLSVNHLNNDGAIVLAKALSNNTSLETLSLASNQITDHGVNALCQALRNHPSLISLDLGYAPSTKVLGAEPNSFGQNSFAAIQDLIQNNKKLRDLNLAPNQLTRASKMRLLETAQIHKTLERLLLGEKQPLQKPIATHLDAQRVRSVYR